MLSLTLFVGTYATGDAQGIYAVDLNLETGQLSNSRIVARVATPGFLAINKAGTRVYAIGKGEPGTPTAAGRIAAFAVDPEEATLTQLAGKQGLQATQGRGPSFVSLTSDERLALVANYHGGSVEAYRLDVDGNLGERTSFFQHTGHSVDPQRQQEPHPHSFTPTPDGRLALAADLGLDKLFVYAIDAKTGQLTPHRQPFIEVAPGAGPRHVAWHPNGKVVYLISEMGGTVDAFRYDGSTDNVAAARLQPVQTLSAFPEDYQGSTHSAEIRVHPSGKFLYTSHRGNNSLTVFTIAADGRMQFLENVPAGVSSPRNFDLDPTGKYLVVGGQESSTIAAHQIDASTGRLTLATEPVGVPQPVCVRFLPARSE